MSQPENADILNDFLTLGPKTRATAKKSAEEIQQNRNVNREEITTKKAI